MADSDSQAGQVSDRTPERARMRELSRALTTLHLGIPLLDEATFPVNGGSAARLQALRAAAMDAVLEIAALSGRLIRGETETPAIQDRESPGAR